MATAKLSGTAAQELLDILKKRFDKHPQRHKDIKWASVLKKLEASPKALWSLNEMEMTGGEPDVVGMDPSTGKFIFMDCSPESPSGRRSLCYDDAAHASRKEHKPAGSAMGLAAEMGIELLDETWYRHLQTLGNFDNKTSSWLQTPSPIRKLGGAIFGDFRYATVFVYHNGAESYYAARGFRGMLLV
ncbi:MAG TPA: DUF4256 domain-containing protein [Chitinophagales bacterium]|nr:DUF4256 domain-containing protein [Chitinophagales bacterium]HNA57623.1 DUF4256 domain-containing protein [Chitinophagales bacterium]HNE44897.1 DUF4256 domain-containing protein [Chitinophagales bacterium]HNJ90476.1 DUF4256 domain-containing protein [Chitinophagales bacterium]HNK99304.1 DUF4256 domain-containing protein [Chitinophagales bacterium]